jgi:small-conductance mechanosensitive channel
MLETIQAWLSDPAVGKLITAVIGLVVIIALRRVARRSLDERVKDADARYRNRKLVQFGSYVLIALLIATVFSDQLGGFTVAFGVAGAGIAFALQEVIASVAGWAAITFSNFYKIGDRVMLGGIKGDVIDIGVLRTTVFEMGDWIGGDNYNGRVVRVANSFVFKEPVFNYSGDFPFLWDEITVPIRHGSDRALARKILEEAAEEITGDYAREVQSTWDAMTKNYRIEDARVLPFISMVMDENWMTYRVRYVVEFKARRATKDRLFTSILDRIDATHGAVRVASTAQEITLVEPSQVRMLQS